MVEAVRPDARARADLRPISLERGYTRFAPGSVRASFGDTVVLCTVHVQEKQPDWRRDSPLGWVTAEYSMLPGSTPDRTPRERGTPKGRTAEIQRLIGRSLRAVVDMKHLGRRTLLVDCDVLQADGGTRTAAITGAYVALYDACRALKEEGRIERWPIHQAVAAASVGIVTGVPCLDLSYTEDVSAEVDLNVVMTEDGRFVEVQGTAEHHPFDRAALDAMLDLAGDGIRTLITLQRAALEDGEAAS